MPTRPKLTKDDLERDQALQSFLDEAAQSFRHYLEATLLGDHALRDLAEANVDTMMTLAKYGKLKAIRKKWS